MINVLLNGKKISLMPETSIKIALAHWGYDGDYFAVAVNHRFVPRSFYEQLFIKDGDDIEVVAPMQGG